MCNAIVFAHRISVTQLPLRPDDCTDAGGRATQERLPRGLGRGDLKKQQCYINSILKCMAMQKTYSRLNAKTISGAGTLITTLIIVTPLCALLFQCGCDWPWSGLDAGCNFYKPGADHQCPWCASMVTGIFSTGLAIISGVLT
jgi:hypothetical protein